MKICQCDNNKTEVKIISDYIPRYETEGAAGVDIRADIKKPINLKPGETRLVLTGIRLEIPVGYEAIVRPRSGLSLKKQLVAEIGTIDSDYRGEIGVILNNRGTETQQVLPKERVAQIVFKKVEQVKFKKVENLTGTKRGKNGFGSTGEK